MYVYMNVLHIDNYFKYAKHKLISSFTSDSPFESGSAWQLTKGSVTTPASPKDLGMFHVVAWSSAVCPRVETNLTQVIDFGLLELDLLIFSLETYTQVATCKL